ncbi:MAG: response regulator [Desulfobacteraceae bacterium]|nr:MAG: response regulator [Desulfobacteraceae bacterium]
MDIEIPLYNSRLIKNYIEYLRTAYPSLDIDSILTYSKLTIYQINDSGFWFTQQNADLLHDILVEKTGDPNISREVGRFASSSKALGTAKQYMIGLMNIASVYLLMEKIYPTLSRGALIKSNRLAINKVEITSKPSINVNEKPYQCENRMGSFEALAKWFTNEFAKVDHPECIHKGDKCCRYIISWKNSPSLLWKRLRNFSFLFCSIISFCFFPFLSIPLWLDLNLSLIIIITVVAMYAGHLEKRELINIIKTQGNAAKDLLDEINIRHENALLIHEIGQAISAIMSIDDLIHRVIVIIERRLSFERGLIMLANKDGASLVYAVSYGYNEEQKSILEQSEFHLNNPSSKGPFVLAFKEQKPFMIDDIGKNIQEFSERSQAIIKTLGVRSLICVPIVYEQRPLGVLAVDNPKIRAPFTQSDLNLLNGVASQLAISIINALSFQRLQESEKKYRDLVENSNSIIMRMNLNGEITFFNEFAQRFFGFTAKDVIGANALGTVFSTNEAGRIDFEELLNFLRNDPNHQLATETETILKNGDKAWITWTHKMIFTEEGQLNEILSIGNDITALKKSAREKQVLEGQLQQAQKMEIIGTLAGGVAHDLNNLLASIIGYPEIMLLDLPKDSPLKKSIVNVKKAGERAAAIVLDLLTLARRGVPIKEVVNLNLTIKEYLNSPEYETLKRFHPNVEVDLNLDANLQNIKGSSVHLSKTLTNLVSNAAEAMPNGGTIWIATINRHVSSQTLVGKDNLPEGNYVILTVTDNGIGISETDKEKIFEPFYTKKNMGRSGTGLGMTVVWGTVKDHKGYIDIQSKVGRGTRFAFYFPASPEALLAINDRLPLEAYMGKGESILVVDDLKDQRELAAQMLQKLNYFVNTMDSGENAVEYLIHHKVDLVLLDMMMDPGIDGLETFRRMRLVNPLQRAIIFSGYSETERVREAEHLGVGAFIGKPFLIEKIGLAVKNELTKH